MACMAQIMPFVLMTALGEPVEPEVKRYFTTVSAVTPARAARAVSGLPSNNASNGIVLSPLRLIIAMPGCAMDAIAGAKASPSSA